MASEPIPPPPDVPRPPKLVRLRVTAPEVQVILRALRTTTTAEAHRLADVLQEEAALLRRARAGSR
jgi:hypothetical protein